MKKQQHVEEMCSVDLKQVSVVSLIEKGTKLQVSHFT
jgi:hypothetical protein